MDERKKNEIINLFKNSVKPKSTRVRTKPNPSEPIHINGITNSTNIVGNGNSILHVHQPIIKPKTIVKTGDGVINASQKARLTALLKEWVVLRNAVRKTKITYASAWISANKQADVNSYHEIPAEKFYKVEKWLIKQIAIVSAMPSAPSKATDWRKSRYKAIHAKCKQLDIDSQRIDYMRNNFDKTSLVDLTDDEVEKVYRWIISKK